MQKTLVNQPQMGENESSRSGAETPKTALTTPAAKDSDDMAEPDSSSKSPAFRFYPNDFLSDRNVLAMSLSERGAYITLICLCWQSPLPCDLTKLSRLCGVPIGAFRKLWPALSVCFRTHPDDPSLMVHPRLERERQKQEEFKRQQSSKGRLGGRPKKPDESQKKATGYSGESQTITQTKAEKSLSFSSSSSFSSSEWESPVLLPETAAIPIRAGSFAEWYSETHERLFSVGYIGNPQKDYQASLQLCEKFTDDELRDAALVWFGMDDDFATSGTRTIPKFASRATKCVQLARKVSA